MAEQPRNRVGGSPPAFADLVREVERACDYRTSLVNYALGIETLAGPQHARCGERRGMERRRQSTSGGFRTRFDLCEFSADSRVDSAGGNPAVAEFACALTFPLAGGGALNSGRA